MEIFAEAGGAAQGGKEFMAPKKAGKDKGPREEEM